MWYIKDFRGEQSGPFTLEQLEIEFQKAELRENATLVKSTEHGQWKPVLLAMPHLIEQASPTSTEVSPYLPFPETPTDSTRQIHHSEATEPENAGYIRIAEDLNKLRLIMGVGIFYASLLLYAVMTRASIQHIASDSPSLSLGNTMMLCVIFFIFPLGVLAKLIRRNTRPSLKSITTTVRLHRKFWTGFFAASTVSVAAILFVLLSS